MDETTKEEGCEIMDGALLLSLTDKAFTDLASFKKISPILIMKKYHLSEDLAKKICQNVWLRQHKEAREMARSVEI